MSYNNGTPSNTEFGASRISDLPPSFCSLGLTQGYYEELMGLEPNEREAILICFRDCVNDLTIFEEFGKTEAFQVSLLRSVHESEIRVSFKSILSGNLIPSRFKFSYKLVNQSDAVIDINVKPVSNPPTNIHVLIGRNGVGKTRLLSGICNTLTNVHNDNEFGLRGDLIFSSQTDTSYNPVQTNPGFANIVTVAFSAFDGFIPLEKEEIRSGINYDYVGLRREEKTDEFKNDNDLQSEFAISLKQWGIISLSNIFVCFIRFCAVSQSHIRRIRKWLKRHPAGPKEKVSP